MKKFLIIFAIVFPILSYAGTCDATYNGISFSGASYRVLCGGDEQCHSYIPEINVTCEYKDTQSGQVNTYSEYAFKIENYNNWVTDNGGTSYVCIDNTPEQCAFRHHNL